MESKDYFEQIKKEKEEWAKKPWIVRFAAGVYEFFRYRLIGRAEDLPDMIKWKYQSLTKGYSDCDIWGLNYFIINKIRDPFKEFVRYQEEHGRSLPMEFAENPVGWLEVLSKIEYAIDEVWKEENDYEHWENVIYPMTSEQKSEHYKKIEDGMGLLGKYLLDLWD